MNPRESLSRLSLSKIYMAMGERLKAEILLREWVALSPKAFDPRIELAKLAASNTPPNTGEVLRHLDEALKLKPEALEARLSLVETLLSLKELSQVLAHLEYILKRHDTSDIHFRIGQTYSLMEKWESAIASLRRAVTLDDKNSNVRQASVKSFWA